MLREFTVNEVWYLVFAARWTLALTAIAFTGGGLLGLGIMMLRVVPLKPAQWLAIGYIQAIQEYNVLARSFPTNLTAMVFSYAPKAGFQVENEAAISSPPKVDFNKQ